MVGRALVHLSVCVSGEKLYCRPASAPNQWLSALTARRGRGAEEKAPGKEQGCGSSLQEQEEGADRVSAAGEQGSWPGRGVGLHMCGLKDVIKAVGPVCTWASASAASAPLLFLGSCLMPRPEPRQPRSACSSCGPSQFLEEICGRSRAPSTQVRPLVLIDPEIPGLMLPILVPSGLPKLSSVGADELGDITMHVGSGRSTWAENSSALSCRRLFQLCLPAGWPLCSCPLGTRGQL